jgi:hypothetical protein
MAKRTQPAFDESTVPPRMIEMVRNDVRFVRDRLIIVNSPFHSRKIMFVLRPQNPCCPDCLNRLSVAAEDGHIQPLHVGRCNTCVESWQVYYLDA